MALLGVLVNVCSTQLDEMTGPKEWWERVADGRQNKQDARGGGRCTHRPVVQLLHGSREHLRVDVVEGIPPSLVLRLLGMTGGGLGQTATRASEARAGLGVAPLHVLLHLPQQAGTTPVVPRLASASQPCRRSSCQHRPRHPPGRTRQAGAAAAGEGQQGKGSRPSFENVCRSCHRAMLWG